MLTGTPQPAWKLLAAALHDGLAAAGLAVDGEACVVSADSLPRLTQALRRPDALIVGLVDHPERVLALWLADHGPQGAAAAIGPWIAGARLLLQMSQAWPGRLVLVDTEDAAAAPDELAAAVCSRASVSRQPASPAQPRNEPVDALQRLAARALLVGEASVALRLYEELLAGCLRLSAVPVSNAASLVAAAIGQERTRAKRLAAADRALNEAQADLAKTLADLAKTQAAFAAQRQREQEAAAESNLLLEQLTQARDEAQRSAQDRDRTVQALASAQADMAKTQAALAEQRQREQEAAAEADLLIEQLTQVQQEVELQYLRAEGLQRDIDRGGLRELRPTRADGLRVMQVRDQGEHRHVHVTLSNLAQRHHQIASLELRLVQHGGRPGLAIFSTQGKHEAIAAWQRDGDERGQGYMLLLPSDDSGRDRLLRLGSSDWTMVLGLARMLQHELATAGKAVPDHWQTIAARLVRQLEDLPVRLRYDRLSAGPGANGALDLTLQNALWGATPLGTVRLRWSTRDRALRWLAPESPGLVPLADWPADAQGKLASEYPLPLGGGRPPAQCRLWWELASPPTRSLALALLDPLIGADAVPPELQHAARALQREARGHVQRARLRAIARRLLRGRA